MALFTDGPAASMEDLMAQDTQLTNVANAEGIDVTQKLVLAQEELALEITTLLAGRGRAEQALWLSAQPNIGNVVVTPALQLWQTFRTLELVYGDAYASQLNDRYSAKCDRFHERAAWAYERLLLVGLGMVWTPVAQAGEPQVVSAQGSLENGTYYVAMTWTNSRSEEGAPSILAPITTTGSSWLVQPAPPPANAAGWNVYAGTDPGALSRQNGVSIAVGLPWQQATALANAGPGPGCGQSPNYLMPMPRMILRG